MLKIIEKGKSNHPIRFLAKPGIKLIAGYACTLVEYNGYIVCDNYKPGSFPFGIIGKSINIKNSNISFNNNDIVPIWHQRMIFRTDNFEHSNYGPGDKLYVGDSGMLTNEPNKGDEMFVARLTGYPDGKRNFFEALWI